MFIIFESKIALCIFFLIFIVYNAVIFKYISVNCNKFCVGVYIYIYIYLFIYL